ncbi:MAG: GGDEF domain-containing protein [Rhizobiaceae bacterium]
MKKIIWRSAVVAGVSALASALLTAGFLTATGSAFTGSAVVLSILCPILIAWPASAYTTWQAERIRRAHHDLARAHAELATAHRQLREKARRDDMTGMLNREAFFSTLDATRRKDDRGALLIIDADHFKRINDSYGHLVGDEALLKIAAAVSRAVRSGDVLGRIGGEEFGVLLVGATDAEAVHVAERIRREVEAIRFRPQAGETLPLTVSIGGTACTIDASVSDLMRAADKRLYEAKENGRNLAIFAPDRRAA